MKVTSKRLSYIFAGFILFVASRSLAQAVTPQVYQNDQSGMTNTGEVKLDSLYDAALRAMDEQNWMQATIALETIRLLKPGFRNRNIEELLGKAKVNPEGIKQVDSQNMIIDKNILRIAAILLLLILVLKVFVSSPRARARYFLMRGQYLSAAHIYETLLQKNPGELKLYPLLANIYLLTNRIDETAIDVYTTVLKLNLRAKKIEKMRSLMSEYYLKQKSLDSEAIRTLEEAMQAEAAQKPHFWV